ncbi:MAG: hypothetical protein JWQ03_3169, partial [Variovorax sp.]|nr:hypothetical protein [Variovorax sp.]
MIRLPSPFSRVRQALVDIRLNGLTTASKPVSRQLAGMVSENFQGVL